VKIAVVGTGIAGMVAAYKLHREHDITVFEADERIGGHTNTVDVDIDGVKTPIDTGFIVFNDRTYPLFRQLLSELRVPSQPTTMSFSVSCERTGVEYRGGDLAGLFAQRRNLLRPDFLRLAWDFQRFSRLSAAWAADPDALADVTVAEFFRREKFSAMFRERYFVPMGSAIWSCPRECFGQFPLRFVVDFYRNHGLLGLRERPVWRVIPGGSQVYVRALLGELTARVLVNAAVTAIQRQEDQVVVWAQGQPADSYDQLVLACHSDQALRILGADASEAERQVLGQLPYQANIATLHTDQRLLPRTRRAWASWNYRLPAGDQGPATVTYNMNLLQGLPAREVACVTLNGAAQIAPERILGQFEYHHPLMTVPGRQAQARHLEISGIRRTWYCGAYWGNGFHEDGVRSAVVMCEHLERTEAWKVACTLAG